MTKSKRGGVIGAVILLFGLAACTATVDPHPAKVRIPGGDVYIDNDHHHRGRGFCPPGHAKKGWC